MTRPYRRLANEQWGELREHVHTRAPMPPDLIEAALHDHECWDLWGACVGQHRQPEVYAQITGAPEDLPALVRGGEEMVAWALSRPWGQAWHGWVPRRVLEHASSRANPTLDGELDRAYHPGVPRELIRLAVSLAMPSGLMCRFASRGGSHLIDVTCRAYDYQMFTSVNQLAGGIAPRALSLGGLNHAREIRITPEDMAIGGWAWDAPPDEDAVYDVSSAETGSWDEVRASPLSDLTRAMESMQYGARTAAEAVSVTARSMQVAYGGVDLSAAAADGWAVSMSPAPQVDLPEEAVAEMARLARAEDLRAGVPARATGEWTESPLREPTRLARMRQVLTEAAASAAPLDGVAGMVERLTDAIDRSRHPRYRGTKRRRFNRRGGRP